MKRFESLVALNESTGWMRLVALGKVSGLARFLQLDSFLSVMNLTILAFCCRLILEVKPLLTASLHKFRIGIVRPISP